MKIALIAIAYILIIVSSRECYAQEKCEYNLNFSNGLPSSNVYHTIVDRLGYLWIATDKGVMRYNGYELKEIDLTQGFINKDIWSLLEDRQGRIWLSSISDRLGYVKGEKYRQVYPRVAGKYYQKLPVPYADGVYFVSTVLGEKFIDHGGFFFCVEKNDTVNAYDISQYGGMTFPISEKQLISLRGDTSIYKLTLLENGTFKSELMSEVKMSPGKYRSHVPCGTINDNVCCLPTIYADGRLFFVKCGDSSITVLNAQTGVYEQKFIGNISGVGKAENIRLIYDRAHAIIVLTDESIYKCDFNMNLMEGYRLDTMFRRKQKEPLSYFAEHPLWGKLISTYQNGLYVLLDTRLNFRKENLLGLTNYVYCGNASDSIGFWWNAAQGELLKVDAKMQVKRLHLNVQGNIKVLPYRPGKRLLVTSPCSYILDIERGTVKQFSNFHMYDLVASDTNNYYYLTKFTGLYYHAPDGTLQAIDKERYKEIIYDRVRDRYCVYNHHKIFLYKKGLPPVILKREDLEAKGINNIEQIVIDERYGNIFVREEKRILLFKDLSMPHRVLFPNYVFKDSKAAMKDDMLVVAGPYGLLFSKVSGPDSTSEPVVYPNTRKLLYNFVSDLQVNGERIVLGTDMGTYSAELPADSYFNGNSGYIQPPYVFVATYTDHTFRLKNDDTLQILQSRSQLFFDIIKPTGAWSLKYAYSLGQEEWQELPNNELSLPRLAAGRYYTLSVRAYDDQWRSDVITVKLHIVPLWWQERVVQRIFWTAGVLLFLLLIYLVIIITRKSVNRKATRRNQLLEIELKSIYAQLNPHFIFNSLSGALYLLKTKRLEDAYQHIYKFSHLVRSYIKSSRNKYILLREELINLQNYIELQQVRFNDRFEYRIVVGEGVDPETKIPALLLQPVVENAIDHGLINKEEKGKLILSFIANAASHELWCIIDDDGIGRARSAEMQKDNSLKTDSYGSSLIEDLISVFNKYEHIKIAIQYFDKVAPDTGTTVTIKIKFPEP